jgi:hypothetical protein
MNSRYVFSFFFFLKSKMFKVVLELLEMLVCSENCNFVFQLFIVNILLSLFYVCSQVTYYHDKLQHEKGNRLVGTHIYKVAHCYSFTKCSILLMSQ